MPSPEYNLPLGAISNSVSATPAPDIGILGRTMNALQRTSQMSPDVAAAITRGLYAPAMNHPQMQRFAANARAKIGKLMEAPGQTVNNAAQAAKAPQQPQPMAIPPQLNDAQAALHVLLAGTPQPSNDPFANMSDDDLRGLVQDDEPGSAGTVLWNTISGAANGLADKVR